MRAGRIPWTDLFPCYIGRGRTTGPGQAHLPKPDDTVELTNYPASHSLGERDAVLARLLEGEQRDTRDGDRVPVLARATVHRQVGTRASPDRHQNGVVDEVEHLNGAS